MLYEGITLKALEPSSFNTLSCFLRSFYFSSFFSPLLSTRCLRPVGEQNLGSIVYEISDDFSRRATRGRSVVFRKSFGVSTLPPPPGCLAVFVPFLGAVGGPLLFLALPRYR
jgi:hypothetical protein